MSEQEQLAQQQWEEFEARRKKFAACYGEHAGFVLAGVYGSMEIIHSLGEKGRQVVAVRSGEYRPWDPETIGVDEAAEGYFLQCINRHFGEKVAILSEEAGRRGEEGKVEYYIVSDPFDGSLLYKRRIPAFWYTTLAIYSASGEPLAAAVCDVPNRTVDFANEEKAFTGRFAEGEVVEVKEVHPADTTDIGDAVLETYMMKVPRMYPASEVWKPLLTRVKFILPNGGPAGYADVAKGNVDIYLALEEAHIENFSSLPIAWRAGAVVTDFDGHPVTFEDDIHKRYFLLCTATEALHEQVLAEIAKIDWKSHPRYREIVEEG